MKKFLALVIVSCFLLAAGMSHAASNEITDVYFYTLDSNSAYENLDHGADPKTSAKEPYKNNENARYSFITTFWGEIDGRTNFTDVPKVTPQNLACPAPNLLQRFPEIENFKTDPYQNFLDEKEISKKNPTNLKCGETQKNIENKSDLLGCCIEALRAKRETQKKSVKTKELDALTNLKKQIGIVEEKAEKLNTKLLGLGSTELAHVEKINNWFELKGLRSDGTNASTFYENKIQDLFYDGNNPGKIKHTEIATHIDALKTAPPATTPPAKPAEKAKISESDAKKLTALQNELKSAQSQTKALIEFDTSNFTPAFKMPEKAKTIKEIFSTLKTKREAADAEYLHLDFIDQRIMALDLQRTIQGISGLEISKYLRATENLSQTTKDSDESKLVLIGGDGETRVNLFDKIIRLVAQILGTFAVLMLVVAAIFMIISQGNEQQLQKGKQIFLYTVLGLLMAFGSYAVVQFFLDLLLW
ncbi:hypothetical protein HN954_00490 [bacterium]|jgi:hypothetical protein|nr:hypothetical protein [bacterium]MBT6831597.1 hypothetical protein [bacterium]MBT6995892.1 hypothetical protein [bacterium]MBT7772666.1 hypothetical protein [bacterium]